MNLLATAVLIAAFVISENEALDDFNALELETCNVTEVGSGNQTTCEFPFVKNGTEYFGCTDVQDPHGNLWCSTRVDPVTKNHIPGRGSWAYCRPQDVCPVHVDVLDAQNLTASQAEVELERRKSKPEVRRDGPCPCRNWGSCSWSRRFIGFIGRLPRSNFIRTSLILELQNNICAPTSVYCCDEIESPATTKRPSNSDDKYKNKKSGTWLPVDGQCGKRLFIQNIFGGKIANVGAYPFVALLARRNRLGKNDYYCGGSVINRKYVLTAAHCAISEDNKPTHVVLGEHTLSTNPDCQRINGRIVNCAAPSITRGIAEIIVHEDFRIDQPILGNDIALIRVDRDIPMSADNFFNSVKSPVSPICLPWKGGTPGSAGLPEDTNLTVIGWGRTTNDPQEARLIKTTIGAGSNRLQHVQLPQYPDNKCESQSIYSGLSRKHQFCAGGVQGEDSCNGDSGGPILYRSGPAQPWYQVGIVSLGTRNCGIGYPGVYTRVSAFIPWIQSKLRE